MNRLYIPTITPIFASVARIIIAIYVALVFVSVLIPDEAAHDSGMMPPAIPR